MLFFVELLVAVVAFVLVAMLFVLSRPRRLNNMGERLPGPRAYPFIGNALDLGTTTTDLYYSLKRLGKEHYGTAFRVWIGNQLFVGLTQAEDLEVILGNQKYIDKADLYSVAQAWLGTGLLSSSGTKWRRRRKIVTPAFHYKILEEFIPVFHSNGEILIDCLKGRVGGEAFDIYHFISLYTMDNLCETAMGLKINAQRDAESEYVKAIRDESDIVMQRIFKPWLQPEILFNLTSLKTIEDKSLKILNGTTDGVIKTRRQEMAMKWAVNGGSTDLTSEDGSKRRMAFLDLLIATTYEGSELTDENIREEVNNALFAGHDTTSSCVSFALWNLAWNPEIQEAVVQELKEVWPDIAQPPTLNKLHELKYMERVIKETLRIYPSVPIIARKISEDIVLSGGLVVPRGATAAMLTYVAHMDPKVFADPETFDPDRFLAENVQGRNPYAYIPFSAGPRNCVGQKFAMLEIKCGIAQLLRSFKFLPGADSPELVLSANISLVAKNGVPLKIVTRK